MIAIGRRIRVKWSNASEELQGVEGIVLDHEDDWHIVQLDLETYPVPYPFKEEEITPLIDKSKRISVNLNQQRWRSGPLGSMREESYRRWNSKTTR